MTSTEFLTSLSIEQQAAFTALRDELMASNLAAMGELVAAKVAELKTSNDARDQAISDRDQASADSQALSAHVQEVVSRATSVFQADLAAEEKVTQLAAVWGYAVSPEIDRQKAALLAEIATQQAATAAKQAEYDKLNT